MSKHTLHLFTAVEIAEELALRDAELLRRIGPAEIHDGAWMHKNKVGTGLNHRSISMAECSVVASCVYSSVAVS